MRNRHNILTGLLIGLAAGAGTTTLTAQSQSTSPADLRRIRLPLELPAIGNIDAVRNWRFGRIESVVQVGASDDVTIKIRIESGEVLETIGPRVLSDLARASNWVSAADSKDQITRPDYVERMVAFDVDEDRRIIAMVSMEPMDRDRQRLRRGLG
jgi:hypothetical protein